jgi:hypothetical protein
LNRSWTASQILPCVWYEQAGDAEAYVFFPGGSETPTLRVTFLVGGVSVLQYEIADWHATDQDCCQLRIVPLSVDYGVCAGGEAPANFIITPVCPVETDCCSSGGLPSSLSATITSVSGTCGCVAGTYEIVWDGTKWAYDALIPGCGANKHLSVVLTCSSGQWNLVVRLYVVLGAETTWTWDVAATCTLPLDFAGTASSPSGVCSGNVSVTITS